MIWSDRLMESRGDENWMVRGWGVIGRKRSAALIWIGWLMLGEGGQRGTAKGKDQGEKRTEGWMPSASNEVDRGGQGAKAGKRARRQKKQHHGNK